MRLGALLDGRRRRAARALARQLDYQRRKAREVEGRTAQLGAALERHAAAVRARLEAVRAIPPSARVVEVGSGAHGLIFFFGPCAGVGVDPLAVEYARLFPSWQRRAPTIAASGEALPFADGAFDVVLCDNVIDHAERPAAIVAELARVLAPGGLLYFSVNVHHPAWGLAARLHDAWNALGVPLEIGPFADHTVHLTAGAARRMFEGLPLAIDRCTVERVRASRLRHAGDLAKRLFFKNALLELIAIRTA